MKTFFTILIICSIFGLILNRIYASIYDQIGQKHLINPNAQNIYVISETKQTNKLIKYVALGDSLTAGVGATEYQASFPYILAQNISKTGSSVLLTNLGLPGAKTQDIIANQLSKTIDIQPDFITVLVGVNDIHGFVSKPVFQKNYQKIIDDLTTKTKAKIVIINIPYLGTNNLIKWPYNWLYQTKTTEFNKVVKKITQDKNLILVDLNQQTRNQVNEADYYSIDQFHPSAQGYKLWSNIIYDNSHF